MALPLFSGQPKAPPPPPGSQADTILDSPCDSKPSSPERSPSPSPVVTRRRAQFLKEHPDQLPGPRRQPRRPRHPKPQDNETAVAPQRAPRNCSLAGDSPAHTEQDELSVVPVAAASAIPLPGSCGERSPALESLLVAASLQLRAATCSAAPPSEAPLWTLSFPPPAKMLRSPSGGPFPSGTW
ncbi:hypothetical protein V5799_012033 [Amblyomma americanum]|uniref:Uncharacterized protein n=1 Tax=Amblyomma americanum TaxID=6943 RepID=A0AAQ4EFY6_AMBAM